MNGLLRSRGRAAALTAWRSRTGVRARPEDHVMAIADAVLEEFFDARPLDPGPLITGLLRRELEKADCRRRRVACVIVLNSVIVGKGHNSTPGASCLAGECPRGLLSFEEAPRNVGYDNPAHPCHAVHAEHAALNEAGDRARGAVAYITEWPCPGCRERLEAAGVVDFLKVTV